MAATSLKLPDALKKRVADLVADSGKTAHAFMVEAIEQAAERAELRERFGEEATASDAQVLRTGKAYELAAVFDYLEQKSAGAKVSRPKARS